jgi:hypothetical protein
VKECSVWTNACGLSGSSMPAGVGLIFDYTRDAKPIRIPLSGTHPAFVARFLRIPLHVGSRHIGGVPSAPVEPSDQSA